MLAGEYFFHNLIRRYTIAFAKIFSDIYIHRTDPYDIVEQSIKIPLTQASKKKFYYQLMQYVDPTVRPIAILLPRISFVLTNLQYAPERQKNTKNTYRKSDANIPAKMLRFFEPSPWNYQFSMTLWAINEADIHQILEQILPFFTPHYTIAITEIPALGFIRDVPVELTSSNLDLSLESGEDSRDRVVKWDLSFTAQGFLYKQIADSAIIKKTIVKLRDIDDMDAYDPYTFYTEEQEVVPWTALESDNWELRRTITEEGSTKVITEPKP
jgi:hypothetical protein